MKLTFYLRGDISWQWSWGPKARSFAQPRGGAPRCYTQVDDPIGLVPVVKQVGQLTVESKNNRPPRACRVGEEGCWLAAVTGDSRAT